MGESDDKTPPAFSETRTHLPRVSAETSSLALDAGADSWDAITPFMESFLDVWEAGESEPSIPDHLPHEPPVLRRLAWVELVKIDLEYRYRGDRPKKRLDEYLEECPEVRDGEGPPADLIFEEYHLRRESGEQVNTIEYMDRYPNRREELERLLAMDSPVATTSLCRQAHVEVEAGERLGDFELMLPLGKGAFGSVFLARQVSMQRLVALKVSSDHGSEPQTLAQLDHPYIVRVFDQYDMPERQLRMMYLQFVPGGTLEGVLKRAKGCFHEDRDGRLIVAALEQQFEQTGGIAQLDETTRARLQDMSWPDLVCRWGAQLAEALDYAHSHNVLHRDVKPANVLLAADGTPKLADFNVSFSSELTGVTAGAFFGGSLAYMSPEQLEAFDPRHERQPDDLDGRGDLYSLALLLWELLAGERPFASEAMFENWSDTLDALRTSRSRGTCLDQFSSSDELTQRLAAILARCMEPEREKRFANGGELARALWLCLQPRAARLLQKPLTGWRGWCGRNAILAVALMVLLPNILAGIFNLFYNDLEIIRHFPDARSVFMRVQTGINLIAFPLGMGLVIAHIWPLARRLKRQPADEKSGSLPLGEAECQIRSLRLGYFVAWVVVSLWAIAGVVYPVALNIFSVDLGLKEYLHFFGSLVYCGVMAAVFPYLIVSLATLRVFYPSLIEDLSVDDSQRPELDAVGRRASLFLLLAGAMPALGILTLVLLSLFTDSRNVMPQLVLSIVGVVGFGLAFLLYREVQQDREALTRALWKSDSH